MKHKITIKWRLALQFSLLTALLLFIFSAAIFLSVNKMENNNIDTVLFVQYENMKNILHDAIIDHKNMKLKNEIFDNIDSTKEIGLFAIVIDPDGNFIEHSSKIDVALPMINGYRTIENQKKQFRFYGGDDSGYRIIIGVDRTSLHESQERLLFILTIVYCIMLFLSFGISALFAGRAMKPIRMLHTKVRNISPPILPPATLASEYPNDEIGQLAASFDEFLLKLEKAFNRERQFTQDASHELRTPLQVLKSSLELMLTSSKGRTKGDQEKLCLMQESVERMERLTDELLFLSRGLQKKEKCMVSFREFLSAFLPQFDSFAAQKNTVVHLDIQDDVELHISRVSLEIVLGNLIKNALQFTQNGSVYVTLRHNSICVSDTGLGIDAKDRTAIFDRFHQLDDARSPSSGFGLGLSICKEICDREDWSIDVQSKKGEGSSFTILFQKK